MEEICVIGAGGHGREIIQILEDINNIKKSFKILGFFDDNKEIQKKRINGYPVLGTIEELISEYGGKLKLVIGIGDTRVKKQIIERLVPYDFDWPIIIHPTARITEQITLGPGVVIFPGCVTSINVKLDDYVCLNTMCSVSHDSHIKKHSTINPGAYINGNVVIGIGAYIGSGSTIIQNIQIGDWSVIGAGAAIIKNVAENSTIVGVPGRVIK